MQGDGGNTCQVVSGFTCMVEPYWKLTVMLPSNVTCLERGSRNHFVGREAGFYLNYLGWFRLIKYILPDALLF